MKPKIVYYKDELHDDFAGNNIKTKALPEKFRYVHRNPFWLIAEFLLYRVIATPIVWLIAKIGFGLRFENRKALKKLRGTGYYMYGNHTQAMMDAYIPALAAFPQRAHILTGPDAFSIPGISHIVQMLGGHLSGGPHLALVYRDPAICRRKLLVPGEAKPAGRCLRHHLPETENL